MGELCTIYIVSLFHGSPWSFGMGEPWRNRNCGSVSSSQLLSWAQHWPVPKWHSASVLCPCARGPLTSQLPPTQRAGRSLLSAFINLGAEDSITEELDYYSPHNSLGCPKSLKGSLTAGPQWATLQKDDLDVDLHLEARNTLSLLNPQQPRISLLSDS